MSKGDGGLQNIFHNMLNYLQVLQISIRLMFLHTTSVYEVFAKEL